MRWSDDPLLERAAWADAWFADAASAPRERRTTWLAQLRASSPDELSAERGRVASVVVACQDVLDVGRAEDQALVLSALGGIPPFDARADELLQSVLDRTTERETELRVRMFLAISAAVRSAPDVDQRYDALLRDTADDDTEFALRVRVNWASTLLGRADFVRAVRVLRAADELVERIDSDRGRGYVWLHYVRLHEHLGDHARQDRQLAQVRELLDRHELPDVYHLYARTMLYRGLDRSDWNEVRRWSDELERLGNGPLPAPLFEHMRRIDAADAAVARRGSEDALEAVKALRLGAPQIFHAQMHVALLQIGALHRAGDAAGAATVLRDTLAVLASAATDLAATTVLSSALELRDAAFDSGDSESASAALEIAAGASLRRIVELDRQVRSEGIAHADDRALLVDARHRFLRERRDLAASVAQRLAKPVDTLGRAARDLLAQSEDRWIVCAWCRAVLTDAGDWLPAGHLLDDPLTPSVTHGICESCRTGLVRGGPRSSS